MRDIQNWATLFCSALNKQFGERIWFVGLQGSYSRNEATDESDIDVVAILDTLQPQDLLHYREMLESLPCREKICGFVSGKAELLSWESSDLFQFYYDTTPIQGSLDCLLNRIDRTAVQRAVHSGVCNIYHACVHNTVHERSIEVLTGLFKSARFIIQAICFLQTGNYCKEKRTLRNIVNTSEQQILDMESELKTNGATTETQFDTYCEALLLWAQKWIIAIDTKSYETI